MPPKEITPFSQCPRRSPRYIYSFGGTAPINEIVNSITNGLDIKLIDPLLYIKIIDPLTIKREQLALESNVSAVKAVTTAIDRINEYFLQKKKEEKHLRELEKAKKRKKAILEANMKNSKIITKEDLERAVDLALNKAAYDQIDPEIHTFLVDELRKIRTEALKKEDYQLAEKSESAARRVLLLKNETYFGEITSSRANDLESKLSTSKSEFEKLKCFWKKKISAFKKDLDHEIFLIEEETNELLKKFDEQFEKPSFGKFKASPGLLQLKQKEKYLAISKRYQEARQLKAEASRIENQEKEDFVKKYQIELETKRNDLIKKQQEKINIKYHNGQRTIQDLVRERNHQLNKAELALKHLEVNTNEANAISSLHVVIQTPNTDQNPTQSKDSAKYSLGGSTQGYSQRSSQDSLKGSKSENHSSQRSEKTSSKDSITDSRMDPTQKYEQQCVKGCSHGCGQECENFSARCLDLYRKSEMNYSNSKSVNHIVREPGSPRKYGRDAPTTRRRGRNDLGARSKSLNRIALDTISPPLSAREDRTSQNLFLQRRMVNSIVYSKSSKSPVLSKPIRTAK